MTARVKRRNEPRSDVAGAAGDKDIHRSRHHTSSIRLRTSSACRPRERKPKWVSRPGGVRTCFRGVSPMSCAALDAATASRFADIALANVVREYPAKLDHVLF